MSGGGVFERIKYIFMHFNGDDCAGIRRGQLNALKSDVKEIVGEVHATTTIRRREEFTSEYLYDQLKSIFVIDDVSYTVQKLKQELNERMEINAQRILEQKPVERCETLKKVRDIEARGERRKTVTNYTTEDALKLVQEHISALNWALFEAVKGKLVLHACGTKSIPEMHEGALQPEKILFGIVRLGFGVGRFRRVKWISFSWIGAKVSVIKRGAAVAEAGRYIGLLSQGIPMSITIEAREPADLDLSTIIAVAQRKIVMDNAMEEPTNPEVESQKDVSLDATMEAFHEALEEEKLLASDLPLEGENESDETLSVDREKEAEVEPASTEFPSVAELVARVRDENSPDDWVLIKAVPSSH